MRAASVSRIRAITTDRTGGRTNKGFEFEDFVDSDVPLSETDEKRERHTQSLAQTQWLIVRDTAINVDRFADMMASALVSAVDQLFSGASLSRRVLYKALSESLQEKLWQVDSLPTGESTSAARSLVRSDWNPDEETFLSYQHSSPEVTRAFLNVAKGFRPDREQEHPRYFEPETE